MCDFGEYLPFDSKLFSGEDPAAYHNRYPEEWARLVREALQVRCLSACASVCPPACLSACLSACVSACVSGSKTRRLTCG